MKAYNNLFEKVCSFDNLHLAYLRCRKNKRYKKDVLLFSFNLEDNLLEIKKELKTLSYKHGKYREFVVEDSKKRLIRAPLLKDRIVHNAVCIIIEPIFEKTFISNSFACRKGKGTHKAIKELKRKLKDKDDKYCYKEDISKYFKSIDRSILFDLIKKKIKDQKLLFLIREIIRSDNYIENKGIPIGNLTSQLFANIYLDQLDCFVKNTLKNKIYFRYMDDFLLIGNKKEMKKSAERIRCFLFNETKLLINPKKDNVFPINKGIDFLGYIVFSKYILLRKDTIRRFLDKVKKEELEKAFFGYAKHANSYFLRRDIRKNLTFFPSLFKRESQSHNSTKPLKMGFAIY